MTVLGGTDIVSRSPRGASERDVRPFRNRVTTATIHPASAQLGCALAPRAAMCRQGGKGYHRAAGGGSFHAMPTPATAAPPRARYAAYAWIGGAAVLFAVMNVLVRLVAPRVHWSVAGTLRAATGAAVASVIATMRGSTARPRDARALWPRSIFGTLAMVTTFAVLGSRALPLGDAATLLNLAPLGVAALAPLVLGERLEWRVLVALALSLAGVVLLLRPSALFSGPPLDAEALASAALAILAAGLTALAMLSLRRAGRTETAEAIAFHFSLTATVAMGVIAIAKAPPIPSGSDVALMLGAGAAAGLAQLAMTRAYAIERAARVGGAGYLNVVANAAFGAWLLGEPLATTGVAGMALVVAGGVVLTSTARVHTDG